MKCNIFLILSPFILIGSLKFSLFLIVYLSLILNQKIFSFNRNLEILIVTFHSKILLMLLGVFSYKYKFKKQNFKREPNLIFSTQSSIIDWLILMNNYCPKFLYIVKSNDNKNDYFIEISYFEVFSIGSGNKFLSKEKYKNKFNIENYLKNSKKPLIIFPENTKTNKQGVLNIRSNLMDEIYNIIQKNEDKILLRSEIIVNLNNDINTIFSNGLKSIFNLCKNLFIEIYIYSQDISNNIFNDNDIQYDKKKFKNFNEFLDYNLQELLMEPNHRNVVSLNCLDHKKFIEYYQKTNADKKANYIKKD